MLRACLPIVRGPLKGKWWLIGRGQPGRVLSGTYEPAHTRLLLSLARPGMTVLDAGAHMGYYSLLLALGVGDEGAVWAFEPDPINCDCLRRHVAMNGFRNVRIEQLAISDTSTTTRFEPGIGSGTGRLSPDGPIQVRSVTLDGFCARAGIRPSLIKLDAEGSEVRALRGAHEVLATHRPTVVVSTHGNELHRACIGLLQAHDYRLEPVVGSDLQASTELLAVPR